MPERERVRKESMRGWRNAPGPRDGLRRSRGLEDRRHKVIALDKVSRRLLRRVERYRYTDGREEKQECVHRSWGSGCLPTLQQAKDSSHILKQLQGILRFLRRDAIHRIRVNPQRNIARARGVLYHVRHNHIAISRARVEFWLTDPPATGFVRIRCFIQPARGDM